jgi:hypothetical protein
MKKLIYDNPLACDKDVEGFILEGQAQIAFEDGRMQLISTADPELGQAANYVFWCPETFPADVEITWEFQPLHDVGLCIFFFAAMGRNGEDLFDERLAKRDGPYDLYHHGDIDAFHISYYRRRYPQERVFRTCNLRKSYGFHLTAISGDPIPEAASATKAYQMKVVKKANVVDFFIDDLHVLHYEDDGVTFGKLLEGGKVGFRQMSPMVGAYANLKVYEI